MISLTCLQRHKIKDKGAGLTEPSGLTLAADGDGLWTVSDDTKRIFRLGLDGTLDRKRSFKIPIKGLEGLALGPSGTLLYAVCEDSNEVIAIDLAEREIVNRRRLAEMAGYDAIAAFFEDDPEPGTKGLEGLTWNSHSGSLFALKEGDPGLMIEVTPGLRKIRGHARLNSANGFIDPGSEVEKVDYSGVCYDPTRGLFWIVSDKARRVFLHDARADEVVHSAPLGYNAAGKYKEVKKAEGVAYDASAGRLYVVSDKEVRLYVFDVRS